MGTLQFASAASGKYGIRSLWHLFGQDQYLGLPLARRAGKAAMTWAVSLLLLGADLAVERSGLLSLKDLARGADALSASPGGRAGGSPEEALSLWLAPAIVMLGYFVCAGTEGYVRGRRAAAENRLIERRERETAEAEAERRSRTEVQAALRALADVRTYRARESLLKRRIGETAAPYEAGIARAEADRAHRAEWDEPARLRMQDALDNLRGAQGTFDEKLAEIIEACEPLGGRLTWAARVFRDGRTLPGKVQPKRGFLERLGSLKRNRPS
jgi:hypothetical protein